MNILSRRAAVKAFGATALALGTRAFAADGAPLSPERHVNGRTLTSDRAPPIKISVPQPMSYLGAERFTLSGVADCEMHAFAESGPDGRAKRLLWIQFEGYLPEHPDQRYNYPPTRHIQLHGMDFLLDTYPLAGSDVGKPGGDREHFIALLRARGVRLADQTMYVRLVHLLDGGRRELMIIYGEGLPESGPTAADLMDGGKAHGDWPSLSKALSARAIDALDFA
jgi:hypothetical protein